MATTIQKKEYLLYRFFEIIPGVLVWTTILAAIFLSFLKPILVIYFIIIFDLYWLGKVLYLSLFLIISYQRMRLTEKKNWFAEIKKHARFSNIYHLILFPTYGENYEVMQTTFEMLKKSNFDLKKCIVVIATESVDQGEGQKTAERIEKKYGHLFHFFSITVHTLDPSTEIQGKGSNIAHAGEEIKKYIDSKEIPYENIIVSVFDIDTQMHPEYLGYLTHTYLHHPRPTRSSYQPIPVFHNNIWDAPSVVRVASYGTTFWLMSEQIRPERLITFSSHSMSFQALVDVGFWAKNVVSEDSRIFLQCLMEYDGDYTLTPLALPVSMDSVLGATPLKTIQALYKQQRRWAWGCENIPYMLWNFGRNKKMKLTVKLRYILTQLEGMHSWATAALLISVIGRLPLFIARETLKENVLFQNTPFLLDWMMNIAMIGLILSVIFSTALLPPLPRHHKKTKYIIIILQWILLPITLVLFGSIPAIEAQTRLMIGKYLGFDVTKKERKM